jgi:hypothetical protein
VIFMRPERPAADALLVAKPGDREVGMSEATEVIGLPREKIGRPPAPGLRIRLEGRLRRQRLDRELFVGTDPNEDCLLHERARELVGERSRSALASNLEQLLVEASSPPQPFTSRAPIARGAICDCRSGLKMVIEKLKTPAYISAQGVAMALRLLTDAGSPLFGNDPGNGKALQQALEATLDRLEHGPVLIGWGTREPKKRAGVERAG